MGSESLQNLNVEKEKSGGKPGQGTGRVNEAD